MNASGRQSLLQFIQGHKIPGKKFIDKQARFASAAMIPENQRVFLCRAGLLSPGNKLCQGSGFSHAGQRFILKHPEFIPRLPKDLIALDWGYEGNHPFAQEAAAFAAAGLDFYVCPGTSAWRSLAGRVENMRENLEAAEKAGRMYGAKGYLLTDWGDEGHWQPLAASLPGIILAGNFAASGPKAANMDLERELDSVMDAPLGGLLLRLGTLYLRGGAIKA